MKLLAVALCLSFLLGYNLHSASAQSLPAAPISYHPFQLSYSLDGKDYHLGGNATEGINVKGFVLTPDVSMEISLDPVSNNTGEVILLLPTSMINNITSVKATVSGASVDTQIRQAFANSTHSALQVAVPQGAQNVVIAAVHVAPEFQFSALVAAASFSGIAALAALARRRK